MRAALEVADIFRQHGSAIERCRTATLGGHAERCNTCHQERIRYNSCRNRHCPECPSLARAQWLEDRQAELLECEYFHVVFTLPQAIAAMAYQNKSALYHLLFQASAETLACVNACSRICASATLPGIPRKPICCRSVRLPGTLCALCGARRWVIA